MKRSELKQLIKEVIQEQTRSAIKHRQSNAINEYGADDFKDDIKAVGKTAKSLFLKAKNAISSEFDSSDRDRAQRCVGRLKQIIESSHEIVEFIRGAYAQSSPDKRPEIKKLYSEAGDVRHKFAHFMMVLERKIDTEGDFMLSNEENKQLDNLETIYRDFIKKFRKAIPEDMSIDSRA